ncbi:type II toxin-antitoxin system YafQ family toxin [Methylacidimicrobium sp. B4]|uniref:type II toxin-antitoxin system RelE/ParE family toxin n=1 Tax=Methylacidimicrobium sp. B4 TaxID=2796139 RepID=UPI0012EB3CA7|nr:type II toxin-antitoxin system YafQ family toxin [Methylacidimicrobium sp. B4]
MRTIERPAAFKRDYKGEAKGRDRRTLDDVLKLILAALASDKPLDPRHRDHDLSGLLAELSG